MLIRDAVKLLLRGVQQCENGYLIRELHKRGAAFKRPLRRAAELCGANGEPINVPAMDTIRASAYEAAERAKKLGVSGYSGPLHEELEALAAWIRDAIGLTSGPMGFWDPSEAVVAAFLGDAALLAVVDPFTLLADAYADADGDVDLGELDPEEVLDEDVVARLFTARDPRGRLLLVYLAEETAEETTYLVCPTSPRTVAGVRDGTVTLRDALTRSWIWRVIQGRALLVAEEDAPLPVEGVRLAGAGIFYILEEHNEWEGETWGVAIPATRERLLDLVELWEQAAVSVGLNAGPEGEGWTRAELEAVRRFDGVVGLTDYRDRVSFVEAGRLDELQAALELVVEGAEDDPAQIARLADVSLYKGRVEHCDQHLLDLT